MPRETFTFDGKRYDVTAKTEKELQRKIARKKLELEEGRITVNKSTLVKKWAAQWLETYKVASISSQTYKGYVSRLNAHILPKIGNMRVCDVKPIHLQRILNELSGCSKDYISKVTYTLFQMFDKAVKNNMILKNPAADLEPPKAENGSRRALTDVERKYFLQVASYHPYGLFFKMMLYCGLRPREIPPLQGLNLDLKNNILKITESKTTAGIRSVPIPRILADELKQLSIKPFDYIFTNNAGQKLTASNMYSMWKVFKREMNIAMGCRVYRNQVMPPYRIADDLVPYCLRHTYCTDLQSAGVPINVAKELMGHTDISVTAKIYTHFSDTAFNNAAELINKHQCGNFDQETKLNI